MRIQDRYASAIHSSCLTVDERTTYSDTDVLGAMGLADRFLTVEKERPLAVALQRMFLGDSTAAIRLVEELTKMIRGKAPTMRLSITEIQATDMARACLAWHRDSACKPCGGHGKLLIRGTKTLGDRDCPICRGTGQRPFEREFHHSMRELSIWVIKVMERQQAQAGAEAMKKIAPSLDL